MPLNPLRGTEYNQIRVPGLGRLPWAIRRYLLLYIRFSYQVADERRPILHQRIQDLFQHALDLNNEPAFFWVPDYKTVHHGPCFRCLQLEAKYKRFGARFGTLLDEMNKPSFREGHAHSKLGWGKTYSKILTYREANSPSSQGIPPYGEMANPDNVGSDWFTDWHHQKITEILAQYIKENNQIISDRAYNTTVAEANRRGELGKEAPGIEALGGMV